MMIGALLNVLYFHSRLSEILFNLFQLSPKKGVFVFHFRRFLELRLKSTSQIQNLRILDFCLT